MMTRAEEKRESIFVKDGRHQGAQELGQQVMERSTTEKRRHSSNHNTCNHRQSNRHRHYFKETMEGPDEEMGKGHKAHSEAARQVSVNHKEERNESKHSMHRHHHHHRYDKHRHHHNGHRLKTYEMDELTSTKAHPKLRHERPPPSCREDIQKPESHSIEMDKEKEFYSNGETLLYSRGNFKGGESLDSSKGGDSLDSLAWKTYDEENETDSGDELKSNAPFDATEFSTGDHVEQNAGYPSKRRVNIASDDSEEKTRSQPRPQPPKRESIPGAVAVRGPDAEMYDDAATVIIGVTSAGRTQRPMTQDPEVGRMSSLSTQDDTPDNISTNSTDGEKNNIHRGRLILIASLTIVVVAVGIGIGVSFGRNDAEPQDDVSSLKQLVLSHSFDGDAALGDKRSPQHQALTWLGNDRNLGLYPEWKRLQRYALATLYYSTKGVLWLTRDGSPWLSYTDECEWHDISCSGNDTVSFLKVWDNTLQGTIPNELALLSGSLEWLALDRNYLSGTIPSEVGLLTRLENLELFDNYLRGSIPSEIGLLTRLRLLDLERNKLTGTIPPQIASLTNLDDVHLYDNIFTGEFTCPDFIEICLISCYDESNTNEACRSLHEIIRQ